jgi:hypothetical protein
VAGDDADILANAALALAYLGEDIGAMMALVDRALALNPSFARGSGFRRKLASGITTGVRARIFMTISRASTTLANPPAGRRRGS